MRKFRDGQMVRAKSGEFPGVGIVLAPDRVDFPPHKGPGWPYAVIYVDKDRNQLMGCFSEDQIKPFRERP
jgi:hypothetical protein